MSDVAQTNPNLGLLRSGRVEGDVATHAATSGVRYDLQWLETIDDRRDNVVAARRSGVVAVRRRAGRSSAAAPGVFYDRVPLRAVANALLSAGNTTDLASLRQIDVSLSPAQAGAPVFPAILDRTSCRP